MTALMLAAPVVFAAAFLVGYRDDSHAHRAIAFTCALLVVAAGALGFVAPGVGALWSGINVAVTVFCALAIVDNVTNRNSYTGFGALLLYPLALATALSLVGAGLVAWRSAG